MIERKKKMCKSCNEEQYLWSRGRCKACAYKEDGSKKISPISKNKTIEKKEKKEKLDPYFFYHISKCTRSENSGVPICSPTKANICHLIDKGRHPSIMSNLDNAIYLTIDEHTRFDKLLFEHRFSDIEKEMPNAWMIALPRLAKIIPMCDENTKFINAITEYIDG